MDPDTRQLDTVLEAIKGQTGIVKMVRGLMKRLDKAEARLDGIKEAKAAAKGASRDAARALKKVLRLSGKKAKKGPRKARRAKKAKKARKPRAKPTPAPAAS